jgi:chromosome segregation ATPase
MRTIEQTFQQLTALISDQTRDLAMAMAELRSVEAERDKLKIERDEANVRADFADLAAVRRGDALDTLKLAHQIAITGWNTAAIERDNARQSLRAAEADAAETESANSDLRTVNARLVADLAAAMERLNHAESIIMQ